VARQEDSGRKRLVAYVVAASDQAPNPADLRAFLAQGLPDYMVPSAFVVLDALPLSPNGKLDRRALPAPDPSALMGAGYVAPRTDAERVLAGIWAEVLGVAQVGVEDNFFELGGDSILSIQVVSRARQAGLSLMPRDLFLHQSVASLAMAAADQAPAVAEQGPVTGAVPLTPIQHWFFDTQTVSPEHFDQLVTAELAEDVDEAALHAALAGVAEHHDALRMRFEHLDGDYRQAAGGEPIALGPKTTSFRHWALRLTEHVASGGLDDELDYWTSLTRAADPALPLDAHGANTVTSTRSVTVALDPDDTRALLA